MTSEKDKLNKIKAIANDEKLKGVVVTEYRLFNRFVIITELRYSDLASKWIK